MRGGGSRHGHRRRDCLACFGAAELHRAYHFAPLAWHSRGSKKVPPECGKGKSDAKQKTIDQSVGSVRASISLTSASLLLARMARSRSDAKS